MGFGKREKERKESRKGQQPGRIGAREEGRQLKSTKREIVLCKKEKCRLGCLSDEHLGGQAG